MIEDDLRAAMRAHDHEAPTAREFVVSAPAVHRRRIPAALASAACVLVVAGAAVALLPTRHHGPASTRSPAMTCPHRYPGATKVPARPVGVDGSGRLAPNETPTRVAICAYVHGGTEMPADVPPLSGSRTLTGSLGRVTDTLSWQPAKLPGQSAPCLYDLAETDSDAYLIALTYEQGTVWVSVPGDHCGGATNGAFDTFINLRELAAAAYETGRWPATITTIGRLGQQRVIVPAGSTSLTITVDDGVHKARRVSIIADHQNLIDALNAGATIRSTRACSGEPSGPAFTLTFGYPVGPSMEVFLQPGCHPDIDNYSLQADNADVVAPLIEKLIKHR